MKEYENSTKILRRRDLIDDIHDELNRICGRCMGTGLTRVDKGQTWPNDFTCPTCKGAGDLPWTKRMILGIRLTR